MLKWKKQLSLGKAQEIEEKETRKLNPFESFLILLDYKITGIRKKQVNCGVMPSEYIQLFQKLLVKW